MRGVEGFGAKHHLHTDRLLTLSEDLPLVAVAVDTRTRIEAALHEIHDLRFDGLVTLERARMLTGPLHAVELPEAADEATKLTVYLGRHDRVDGQQTSRAIVDLLHERGIAGATVLLGVDGTYHGWRARATFVSPRRNATLMIISVGRRETLAAALPDLSEALEWPVVTLEGIAQLKHDGELLEELPIATERDHRGLGVWQTIRVYTRQSAQVDGHPLHTELTRRLRHAGAAGVTTIRGHWGYSSDEPPHGDKLGRLTSHAPTYTTYIDRPAKVAELWPIVDEMTAAHSIVTSLFVPAYRERRGERVGGGLRVADV
jgi:PII-like signaling protein